MAAIDDQIAALLRAQEALSAQLQTTEDAARQYSADIIAQLTALRTQFGAANPQLAAALNAFAPLHDRLERDLADAQAADPGAQPVITGLSPAGGTTAGGTLITVSGRGLRGATAVAFGATTSTGLTVLDDTSLTCVSPPGPSGTVNVQVTTKAGTTPPTAASGYTYA